MYKVLLSLFLAVAIALIILITIQQGKGTSLGSSSLEGLGSSNTLFGASGSNRFITRLTIILAILFFSISLTLDNFNNKKNNKEDNLKKLDIPIGTSSISTTKSEKNSRFSDKIPSSKNY